MLTDGEENRGETVSWAGMPRIGACSDRVSMPLADFDFDFGLQPCRAACIDGREIIKEMAINYGCFQVRAVQG